MSRGSEYASAVGNLYQLQAENIAERNRAQANAGLQKAQIWGGTLSNLGQMVANLPQQMRERKIAGLKEQELLQGFQDRDLQREKLGKIQSIMQNAGGKITPDVVDAISAVDLDAGQAVAHIYQQAQDRAQRLTGQRQTDELNEFAGIKVDDPSSIMTAHLALKSRYPDQDYSFMLKSDIRPQVERARNLLRTQGQRDVLANPPPPEQYTLNPGDVRFQGDQQIASVPPNPPSPPADFTLTPGGQRFRGGTGEQIASVPPLPPSSPTPRELTPNAALQMTRSLRNDFTRETAAATTIRSQLANMKSSLEAVKTGAAPAGSQGVLVTFQKILDPTSVVRESEYDRSASGLSLKGRMEGLWMRISQGGAGVTVKDLQDFVSLAEQFAANQTRFAAETRTQIDAIAREYGLKPELITRDLDEVSVQPSGTPEMPATGPTISYEEYQRRRGGR